MTFKEKLQKEHPDKIAPDLVGGCSGCPYSYGYESYDDRPCEPRILCPACWNREIPGTEPAKPSSNISLVDLIERAGTKKDISLMIHINGDDTTISVYPCPDPSEKKGNPVAEAYKYLVNDSISAVDAIVEYENGICKLVDYDDIKFIDHSEFADIAWPEEENADVHI